MVAHDMLFKVGVAFLWDLDVIPLVNGSCFLQEQKKGNEVA